MNSTAASPLRADAQRNRERVLVAAAELFRTRGLGVSMEDIAREAGVGVGTLYRRFRNRDELIDALFESRLSEFADVVRACAAIPDAWAGVVSLLEQTLEIQAADRGLKHLFHSRDNGDLAPVAAVRDLVFSELAQMTARAQADGTMRTDIAPMDIALLSFQIGALADLTAEQDPGAWRRALAIALDGLRADGPARELPPGPIDQQTFELALECWRPPAHVSPAAH